MMEETRAGVRLRDAVQTRCLVAETAKAVSFVVSPPPLLYSTTNYKGTSDTSSDTFVVCALQGFNAEQICSNIRLKLVLLAELLTGPKPWFYI